MIHKSIGEYVFLLMVLRGFVKEGRFSNCLFKQRALFNQSCS